MKISPQGVMSTADNRWRGVCRTVAASQRAVCCAEHCVAAQVEIARHKSRPNHASSTLSGNAAAAKAPTPGVEDLPKPLDEAASRTGATIRCHAEGCGRVCVRVRVRGGVRGGVSARARRCFGMSTRYGKYNIRDVACMRACVRASYLRCVRLCVRVRIGRYHLPCAMLQGLFSWDFERPDEGKYFLCADHRGEEPWRLAPAVDSTLGADRASVTLSLIHI